MCSMFSTKVRDCTPILGHLWTRSWLSPTLRCCKGSAIVTRSISASATLDFQKMIRRDKARRRCVAQYESERLRLRAIVKNKLLPEIVQQKARDQMASQPRDASVTRVRNRCVVTGRARGVITEYGLCRMKFRKLADFGHLSGMTRSSW